MLVWNWGGDMPPEWWHRPKLAQYYQHTNQGRHYPTLPEQDASDAAWADLQQETPWSFHVSSQTGIDVGLQGLLCGVLQVIVQKLSDSDAAKAMIMHYADPIMESLLSVFAAQGQQGVHEEAMLAVGALTYASGRGFSKYMHGFFPYLKLGLANHQVHKPFPSYLLLPCTQMLVTGDAEILSSLENAACGKSSY